MEAEAKAEGRDEEVQMVLEYDSQDAEGRRAEVRDSLDAGVVGRGCSIDVRVLVLLE